MGAEFGAGIERYPIECRPPLWARGGHAQTILAHLTPTLTPTLAAGVDGARACDIEVSCGDRLRAFYKPGKSSVLVIAFHGLSGDSGADYMRVASRVAQRAGHSILVVNHRGCGAGRGLAGGMYHSGRADDVGAVIRFARAELPEERVIALGFSLSGNALLLLLGTGATDQPDGAIAINPPIDLRACSIRISTGWNRLYDRRFVRRCTQAVRERREDGLLDPESVIPRVRTLWEFDEEFTAPFGGFADAEDYYRKCSTRDRLHRIACPTVVITAADDPFVPVSAFREAQLSCAVHLHIEPSGGHVGYLSSDATRLLPRLLPRRWLDGALAHYIEELRAVLSKASASRA